MTFPFANSKPVHKHDCDECVYYGLFSDADGDIYDLYYCPTLETYIARYGEDGNYITSSPETARLYPETHPINHLARLHRLMGVPEVTYNYPIDQIVEYVEFFKGKDFAERVRNNPDNLLFWDERVKDAHENIKANL